MDHDVDGDSGSSATASDSDSERSARLATHEPEGTVIFELFGRKVIRHGDKATKINPDGIRQSEVDVMRFVRERMTIPVPHVYEFSPTSITMDYVEGSTLQEAWNGLSEAEQTAICAELRDYLGQLREIKGSYIGAFGRGPAVDSRHFAFEGGPFATEAEWNDFLLEGLVKTCPPVMRSMVHSQLRTDHDIVLTHGDLVATNILVRDGHIVALIDWERAGFYPEYLEMVKPLRGPNWRIGYYNAFPDLFPRS
ncbi:81c509fc-c53d-4c7b-a85a-e31d40a780a4 [Thermothielavioides terrestris]|uniref:81c509fc-c53d-4c7b-a85a-e31d40a780a4 n=1 Tax=Thermothielavioides terrestris TaxID=2587410 RepID=A0A3S4CC93_9PEZI|nr:81c509fc-c53d-4c7b-a85a-e31d40a780a4 [Thermothielavioides terrestris]